MKTLAKPKAVLFDWDHTLSNPDATILRAFNHTVEAMQAEGYRLPEQVEPAIAATEMFARHDFKTDTPKFLTQRFTQAFGDEVGQKALHLYFDIFREHTCEHTKLMTGALDTMRLLQRNNIPFAVVSFKRQGTLDAEVDALTQGKLKPFPVLGRRPDIKTKPHPEAIDEALKALHIPPGTDRAKVWMVGDSLGSDVGCARAAECTPVWFGHYAHTGYRSTNSDAHRVKNHHELQTAIRRAVHSELAI